MGKYEFKDDTQRPKISPDLLAARHDLLDLAGLADVPGHGPAVLAVAVPLGLLVPRAPLQLAHLGKRKMKEKDRGERKLNF